MKKIMFLLSFIFLFSCVNASASFISGAQLKRYCNAPTDTPEQVACLEYIKGVFDGVTYSQDVIKNNFSCDIGDESVKSGIIVEVVKQYMNANPQVLKYSAPSVIMGAITETTICK